MCACVMPPPTQNDRESWGCMALLSRWPPDAWEAPCPAGEKSNRKEVSTHATSAGVVVQNQQQPCLLLWVGKWKTSLNQSQSALISTKAALHPRSRGTWRPLLCCGPVLSLGLHGVPSCLQEGHRPVAQALKDHASTAPMSSHVCFPTCLCAKATNGNLSNLWGLRRPGMLRLRVSMLSFRSHCTGIPSPHMPSPSIEQPALLSHFSRCCRVKGSKPDLPIRAGTEPCLQRHATYS